MKATGTRQSAIARIWGLLNQPQHPYRPATTVFVDVNVDRVADELQLVTRGKERGAQNRPTADAQTNCEIFVIDRRDFLPFVRSHPALAMKFIELLCARLRRTSEQVEQIILLDLPGRLASALLALTAGRKLDPESRTIAITQQEISEMVGMTRESINKQLGVWATRQWVRLEHGAIVVLDANSLRKLAEAGSGGDE